MGRVNEYPHLQVTFNAYHDMHDLVTAANEVEFARKPALWPSKDIACGSNQIYY